jgi:decaprenyl-phosphate phosphoribosyltransferase
MTLGLPDSASTQRAGPYESAEPVQPVPVGRPSLRGHVQIMRIDHWTKNVFVLPGVVAAVSLTGAPFGLVELVRLLIGLLAIGLVASSNYTINEVLDAPFDATHPSKRSRPVPSGRVNVPLAYLQWIALGVAGVALGWTIGGRFTAALIALWVMGCVYNIRPVRSKDVPYVDVLTEAINNPIRMVAGWYIVATAVVPPATMLLGYWMVGCYFMAIKRYAEGRELADAGRLTAYRRSLAYFTPERMMIAIMFYCAAAMLFFGAFIIRYRLELVLSFPFVALVMATYLELGFRHDSAAQNPEKLYREPKLMLAVVSCAVVMLVLMYVDLPVLHTMIDPAFLGGVQPAN